jgi:hypothetical protein
MAALRPSVLCPRSAHSSRAEAESPMSDLIYIAAGFAIVGVFVLYAIGLRRV